MKLIILACVFGYCAGGALNSAYLPPGQRAFQGAQSYQSQDTFNYQSSRPRAAIERNAAILRSNSEVNEQGFQYAFETENGIQAEETGHEADGIQAQGSYSYTGDDGQVYSVRYSADANGFQAQGAHLPTAPPVPEEIARALEQNARDEAAGIFDDGSYQEGKYADASSGAGGVVVARAHAAPSRPFGHFGQQSGFRSQSGYHY